ncbi:MAG: hypothetical protein OXF79_02570 [Chloroflexi bacterium]|nr:hypothetical protein [Chloroflexota bacterium]
MKPILILCIIATTGLCNSGLCGMFVIDNDEYPLSMVVGIASFLAFAFVWSGVTFLWRRRLIGRWFILGGAVLTWTAFIAGIWVGIAIARGNSWISPMELIALWVITVWMPGVMPATAAAIQSFGIRRDTNHIE